MDRIKIALNRRKPGNYAFYCPVSNLHLTLSNPIGISDRVTPSILRGLRMKTILDVNEVIDLEAGKLKQEQDTVQNIPESPKTEENKPTEEVVAKVKEPVEMANKEPEKVITEEVKVETKSEETPIQQEITAEEIKPSEEQTSIRRRGRRKKDE